MSVKELEENLLEHPRKRGSENLLEHPRKRGSENLLEHPRKRGSENLLEHPRKRGSENLLELTVERLVPGGEGLAFVDEQGERRAVFVRGSAPGDRVIASVDFAARPARGTVRTLVVPGPDRQPPPCRHLDRCGACDFMHLAPLAQSKSHVAFVRDALGELGRDLPLPVRVPVASSRSRARLHVHATRAGVEVGMHRPRTREPVVVDACLILASELDAFRAELPALFAGERGRGEAQIALGFDGRGEGVEPRRRSVVLDLLWRGELSGGFFGWLEKRTLSPSPLGFSGARVSFGGLTTPLLVGDPRPGIRAFDGALLELPPGGFGQPSDDGNELLAQRVAALAAEALGKRKAARVVELYAGAGNLTVAMADAFGKVDGLAGASITSVESDGAATRAAARNVDRRGLAGSIKAVCGDAESYAWGRADLVVLDPPRTGARRIVERLTPQLARAVVYVSCDPPTLARDLRTLAGAGYVLRAIELVEMFPETSHVETIVQLSHPLRDNG